MKLLFFLKIGVILGQTFQSQFVGQPNELSLGQVLLLESFNFYWVGGRKEHNLRLVHQGNDALDNFLKVIAEKLVDFIKYEHFASVQFSDIL